MKLGKKITEGTIWDILALNSIFFHSAPNGKRRWRNKSLCHAFPQALSVSTEQQLHTNPPLSNSWTLTLSELYSLDNPVTAQFNTTSPAVHESNKRKTHVSLGYVHLLMHLLNNQLIIKNIYVYIKQKYYYTAIFSHFMLINCIIRFWRLLLCVGHTFYRCLYMNNKNN